MNVDNNTYVITATGKKCFRLADLGHKELEVNTGCPRRNVPDFGRVFLMVKYTDITQNTYVQS
jgi:hypothetical protein